MSPPPTTTNPGRFALAVAAVWLLLFALYLLCAGSLSLNEGLAGAATAALGSIWWAFAGRGGGMRFSGWMSGLGPVGHAILGLPGATGRVAGQLVQAVIHGGPRGTVAYERDGASAWASAELPSERALGLIAASLSPDSYVVREKGGDTGIVIHALAPNGG